MVADVKEPIDFRLNVVEIAIVGARRVVSPFVGPVVAHDHLSSASPCGQVRALLLERALAVLGFRRHNPARPCIGVGRRAAFRGANAFMHELERYRDSIRRPTPNDQPAISYESRSLIIFSLLIFAGRQTDSVE